MKDRKDRWPSASGGRSEGGKVATQASSRLTELEEAIRRKWIRWVAFVYGRRTPELQVAEKIIRQAIGGGPALTLMADILPETNGNKVDIVLFNPGRVEEYSDGSRAEGVSAVATRD